MNDILKLNFIATTSVQVRSKIVKIRPLHCIFWIKRFLEKYKHIFFDSIQYLNQ